MYRINVAKAGIHYFAIDTYMRISAVWELVDQLSKVFPLPHYEITVTAEERTSRVVERPESHA